jgi:hypothetical protein
MLRPADLRHAGEELPVAATPDVFFEDLIRIEQITHDEIEAAEVVDQLSGQLTAACEETRELTSFDRPNRLRVEAILRQGGDVRISENLEVRLRKTISQKLDRRKRQDEVADRAAANHEDPIHP